MQSNDEILGMHLAQQGRYTEALPLLERANAANPKHVALLHTTASLLQMADRLGDASHRYAITGTLLPNDVGVLVGWARSLLMAGDEAAPVPLLNRALRLDPAIASSTGSLRLLWNPDAKDVAVRVLRTLTAFHPKNADLLCQFAQILRTAEYVVEAEQAWLRYMALRPDDPIGPVEAGRLAVSRGDREAARTLFSRALQIAPEDPRALAEAAHAQREPLDADILGRIQISVARERDPENLTLLHDALARHHEGVGDYVLAATHVASMNAVKEHGLPTGQRYDPVIHAEEVEFAARTYTTSLFDRLHDAGSGDRRPVFVVGLPRSGTTLLERMLAAHPAVVGVGEQSFAREGLLKALARCGGLPELLSPAAVADAARWHLEQLNERLQRQAAPRHGERIVDKLPDNYLVAGWIHIAFPNAIIIHSLRDPRDVAWSCWSTHFAKINWSLRLDHIAGRIEQHRVLMRHWRALSGMKLVELRYERLVADPETELRRVLAAMSMDWDAQVLNFAAQKGFVASASRYQVREGINTRGIGRWRNYEDALRPILPRLEAIVAQDALEATPDLRLP